MNRATLPRTLIVIWLCSWLSLFAIGQEGTSGKGLLSLSELEQQSLRRLEEEKARLTRLLTDRDPFEQCHVAGDWESMLENVAKAQAIGDIVRMQYLLRALEAEEDVTSRSGRDSSTFELATDPVRLTIVQRNSKPVPGFHDAIRVRIGDITQAQTLLEIVCDEALRPVVDTISVQAGDVIPFKLGSVQYYLSVVELRNFLVGDDFAVLEISTRAPETRPEVPTERDQSATIEELLNMVESSGVIFIRNGREATASVAATHLRNKWRSATPPIQTVDGFIDSIASRSSVTGNLYYVKLADGSQMEMRTWLREQLDNTKGQAEP